MGCFRDDLQCPDNRIDGFLVCEESSQIHLFGERLNCRDAICNILQPLCWIFRRHGLRRAEYLRVVKASESFGLLRRRYRREFRSDRVSTGHIQKFPYFGSDRDPQVHRHRCLFALLPVLRSRRRQHETLPTAAIRFRACEVNVKHPQESEPFRLPVYQSTLRREPIFHSSRISIGMAKVCLLPERVGYA